MTKTALQKCDLFIIQTRWTHEDGVEICYLHNEAHANVVQRLESNGPTIPIGLFFFEQKANRTIFACTKIDSINLFLSPSDADD